MRGRATSPWIPPFVFALAALWPAAQAAAHTQLQPAQLHRINAETSDDQTNDHPPLPDPRRKARFVLLGVDCFGLTSGESCEELQDAAGVELGQAMTPGWSGRGAAQRLQLSRGYAFVALSPIFTPDGAAWLTIDVVHPGAQQRLSLNPAPAGSAALHSNLLEVYGSFANLHLQLLREGEAPALQMEPDGTWQANEPRLAPFTALFRAEAPAHRDELIRVLTTDREPSRRRAAAGLLGYDSASEASADALSAALLDPDRQVRAEAARALTPRLHLAARVEEAPVDVEVVCRLLDLPSAADRSAAAALLAELSRLPELRARILERAFPVLLQMLASPRSPISEDAHLILERTSGLDLGRDPERWAVELRQRLQRPL